MLKFKELKDGRDYIATDLDGKKHHGTFVNKYFPEGTFFCVYPAYTADGRKNNLISFEEV